MSGFESVIPMAVSTVTGAIRSNAAQNAAADAQAQAADQRNRLIAAQQDRQARQQHDLLEKQQASARAQMGAWGIGGGSADAILEGMAQHSAETIAADDALVQFKMERNRAKGSGQGGSNLLDSALGNGMKVFQSFFDGP